MSSRHDIRCLTLRHIAARSRKMSSLFVFGMVQKERRRNTSHVASMQDFSHACAQRRLEEQARSSLLVHLRDDCVGPISASGKWTIRYYATWPNLMHQVGKFSRTDTLCLTIPYHSTAFEFGCMLL